jgi:hypothetical protein
MSNEGKITVNGAIIAKIITGLSIIPAGVVFILLFVIGAVVRDPYRRVWRRK